MSEFSERAKKKLPKGYVDKIEGMGLPSIKEEVYKLQRSMSTSKNDMDNDPNVEDLRERLSTEEAPFRDSIAGSKLMIKYISHVCDGKGW